VPAAAAVERLGCRGGHPGWVCRHPARAPARLPAPRVPRLHGLEEGRRSQACVHRPLQTYDERKERLKQKLAMLAEGGDE
jgi:hypothetical protein